MAGADESPFSLMSLEEELTCSICLSPFDCPVTIPCGHNFCQECLLATWKDTYSCPQCRTFFATKPQLKKNTVLSTVVETFNLRSTKSDVDQKVEEVKAKEPEVIRCDTCMEAEASQTCLTCMASFCEEHLRPHRENPVFRIHQLSEPVGDLLQRFCQDHHKLMEFFCSRHDRPICSICLQQVHQGCPVITPEEQRSMKESNLRQQLSLLDKKITKTEDVISQIKNMQNKLKESAINRNKALAVEYQQVRDMLARDERDALNTVEHELQTSQSRLQGFMKKFTENIDNMNKAKEEIHSLLSQSQTLQFLQASSDLPPAANFDPHSPRVTLDSKKVTATQAFAFALKEHLTAILKRPIEARLPIFKPDERATASSRGFGPQPGSEQPESQQPRRNPRSHSPGRPPTRPFIQPVHIPLYVPHTDLNAAQYAQGGRAASASGYTPLGPETHQAGIHWAPGNPIFPNSPSSGPQPKLTPKKKKVKKGPQSTEDSKGIMNKAHSMDNLLDLTGNETLPETSDIPPDISSAEKRSELLKYASVLTLDPKTAHKRIALSEGFTKALVSDEHSNYPDGPERFAVCSQVLASMSFSRGRHYWEVRMGSNNFIGIGLAYGSIDRKGPTSRLGRNGQSWCVEWFNVKLSAWHNSCETMLVNPNPKRVGVFLDCEAGTATFYTVAERAYPFHTFVFPFAEAVFPAFWMFSSGSSITLCKLQA